MSLKDIYFKVKKGVRAGIMAAQQYDMQDVQIASIINEFRQSDTLKLMLEGQRYYEVESDILNRKITKKTIIDGLEVEIEETYKANNKLAHAKYKNLVDEKVAYLLSSEYTLSCDNEDYSKYIKDILGKHFQYQLSGLGYEASNKGKGWLHVYIDEQGDFKTLIIPAEQCIPIWTDASHTELSAMIRVYDEVKWIRDIKKVITYVEYWTSTDVLHGVLDNSNLFIADIDGAKAHYTKDDQPQSWGKVPFVPFKNNRLELPDIKFVKVLLDSYDKARSDVANYVEETKNLIYVLKGYGGEDIGEFMQNLNLHRAIPIDDPKEGGVDALTPTVDITAVREHYEQLKRDITEDGQGINQDLDKFGSAPSGVTLRFLFRGLDLKCNALEVEFKMGFEFLLYFINRYLSESGQGEFGDVNVDIIFNREAEIDETEVITNCDKSLGTISRRTIILNHPWVTDADEEEKQIQKEEQEYASDFDKVPPVEGNGDGQE